MGISGGECCACYNQPPNVNHTIDGGWQGSLNTFLLSALNTKWITKNFPEMLQKQHVLLLFQNWHLSSTEAECTWWGGGSGWDRRTKELVAGKGRVCQGQHRLVEGTVFKNWKGGKKKVQEARREIRTNMHELDFLASQAKFCKRAPIWDHLPLMWQWWERGRIRLSVHPGLWELPGWESCPRKEPIIYMKRKK